MKLGGKAKAIGRVSGEESCEICQGVRTSYGDVYMGDPPSKAWLFKPEKEKR